jgi:signal transduction histidine kinase
MAAEAAFDRLPEHRPSRAPLSRRQVEALLSRAAAAFSLVFFLQTFPIGVEQATHLHDQRQWTQLVALLLIITLAATCAAALVQRWVRLSAGAFATVYLLAVITWPLASRTPLEPSDGTHWLYHLLTVSTALAAIALSARLATVYLLVATASYAISGSMTSNVGATREQVLLEAGFSILLGGAILVIIAMLRQAASAVDRAQAAAFESYAEAVRQHATEVERVQVDSIVHDSVLTTLLSAARATTPEAQTLAARMAANAIGFLRQAALIGPVDGATVPIAAVARKVAASARAVGAPFDVRLRALPACTMPAGAADAVQSAAVQAMVNSVQHAGEGAHRWIELRAFGPLGLVIEVGDDGRGFVPDEASTERLGLRVSIIERVVKVGGRAEIDTQPGEGTVVTLRWPVQGSGT